MRKRAGLSLAEVMVGLLLLSTFAVVLLGVVPSAVFGIRGENHRLVAVTMAHRVVEQVSTLGFERICKGEYELPAETHQQIIYRLLYGIYDSGLKGDPQIYEMTKDWVSATSSYRLDVEVQWVERNRLRKHFISTLVGRT
ncbi:MAG: hypothetical protein KF760_11225 [Candidatus Eremiobacteraeota bacterium]|nr:hypothetical protein [Candidatus Eremiobacteraeota bacterium]MCW5870627.1 hypothetical protein [Candidatus Eremiobacteraeota bacterium]